MGDGELQTVPALARKFGVGVRIVRRAIRSGELPAFQLGGAKGTGWLRLREVDFVAWLSSRRALRVESPGERVAERVLAQIRRESRVDAPPQVRERVARVLDREGCGGLVARRLAGGDLGQGAPDGRF